MNQKNFIICCFILLCCLFQPLYAAVNDKTICQVTWNKTDFNSVQNGKFVKSIRFGEVDFVEITISGQKDIQYKTTNNYVKYGHLDLGSEKKGEFWDTLYWAPKGSGYKIQMVEIASLMRAYAASEKVWVTWGKESEKTIYHNSLVSSEDPNSYTTSLSTTQFQATDTYMPFKLRRDASASQPFILAQLQLKAYVIPDAPSWKTSEANVKVTVNQSAASIHWYALKDYVQVTNAVFEPTLRCDADGENAPYLVWNTARDSFYVIKPGDYSLRAYVDKSDELYCSSAYSSSNLTVHATSDASEEADAELFFVVDGQIANQTNKTNHGWETYLFYESGNSHKVEYIYAYANPTITADKRTEKGVHYTEDTDPYSDIFSVDDKRLKDTLQVTVNGTHTATLVLTIQQANHVPFTMNTTKKKDLLVVPTSLKDASWNTGTNRMEFAYKDLFEMNDERVFEVLFTGVPDSVVFGYGNNSDYSASSSKLTVAYATVGSSTYTPFDTITGKPSGTQFYNAALLPNVNRLRFTYKGVQKVGWITNLTVTERKELKVRTADDTIRFVARYNPDTTLYYDAEMDWYNLTPDLQYMSTSTTDGDLFGAKVEDVKVGWDQYGENQKLQFFYKPARVGRQTSDVLVYSADITPTADMPASKLLARRVLEALTGFGADDVNFTHQTDTVEVAMGADTANLFMVLDKAGRAIESDSIFITYDYDTTQLAVDAEGKITPLCIGYHKVVAHLQGNMIMPELSDSLYICPSNGQEYRDLDDTRDGIQG